jgi:hypothetical protein
MTSTATTATTTTHRYRVPSVLLACLLTGPSSALDTDTASEHTRLTTLVRQLDMLDRLGPVNTSGVRLNDGRYSTYGTHA